ncbi:MAG: hypothetical protein GX285_11270 [Clostridiales bacterium]|nr:hypothetical protein [Clostridiales bacterium]
MQIIIRKEKIKTISIVVLVFTTILLLYFLWNARSEKKNYFNFNITNVEEKEEGIKGKDFLEPFRLRVNFGGNKYTVLYSGFDNVWYSFIDAYRSAFDGEIFVKEISKGNWDEILKGRSVKFDLGNNIPYAAMREVMGINNTIADEVIGNYSAAAYSEVSPDSFFIYDKKKDKYFMIVSEKKQNNEILNELDELEKRDFDIYDTITALFGAQNDILIPTVLKNNIQKISGDQEIQVFEQEKIKVLAERFFGDNFDFIRKIEETNGTVIYMYGYGQKMLLIDRKGFIEYKEVLNTDRYTAVNYTDALEIAVSFVTQHGSWKTLNGTNIYPYLKESVNIEEANRKGYKFTFGYRINGYPVYYQEGEAIEIKVVGNQITYYKRYLLNQKDTLQYFSNDSGDSTRNILSAKNILTNNYEYIKEKYVQENGYNFGNNKEEVFNRIVSMINMVDVGYFSLDRKKPDEEIQLIPAWIFMTDKYVFLFNAQTGESLGSKPIR